MIRPTVVICSSALSWYAFTGGDNSVYTTQGRENTADYQGLAVTVPHLTSVSGYIWLLDDVKDTDTLSNNYTQLHCPNIKCVKDKSSNCVRKTV